VPPYWARISAIYFLFFGKVFWFRLPCATPGNEAELRIYGGWVKTPFLCSSVCGPKFTNFSDDVEEETPCTFQRP